MKVYQRFYSIIIALLLACQVRAQNHPLLRLGMGDGLTNDIVRDMAQDARGYIWLATEDGLNCFDGNGITPIRRGNGSLPADELNCLLHTDSALWIGTQREGLVRLDYRTGQMACYYADGGPDALSANSVTDLTAASDGGVWISTYWGGICHYIPQKRVFQRYDKKNIPGLPSNQVWTAVEAGGKLYVGHVYNDLSIIDLRTKKVENLRIRSDNFEQIFAICPMNDDLVWLGTGHGLVLFDAAQSRFVQYADHHPLLGGEIRALSLCSDKDELMVTTEHSRVAVINLKQDIRIPAEVTPNYHFVTDWNNQHIRVNALLNDRYGNLWTGLEQGGASMIPHIAPRFTQLSHSPYLTNQHSLTSPSVSAISVAPDGSLAVGLRQGGINIFRDGKRTHVYNKETSTLVSDDILMLHHTRNGTLWAGLQGHGLYGLQKNGDWRRFVDNSEVRTVAEAADGTLWVGTSLGVFHVDPSTGNELGRIHCKVDFVWALTFDNKGQLWVGTFGGGIEVFTPDGKPLAQFNNDHNKNFPSNTICQLLTASDGRIYAATHEGLAVFSDQPKLLRHIDSSAYNINHHIQSLAEDAYGNIWMGTYRGLAYYATETDSMSSFRDITGVPSTTFLPASAGRTSDGILCFGSTSGLCMFSPNEVLTHATPPEAYITNLTLLHSLSRQSDTPHTISALAKDIIISHRENTLRINYAVSDFAFIGQVEYAYRLRGLSDEWYSSGSESHVEFNNLPAGSYVFEVKTRLLGEEWSATSAQLNFRIKPAPWLSPWAIILYIVLAIIVAALIWWLKQNKERLEHALHIRTQEKEHLEQEAEQLKRKATTIHEQQKQALQQAVSDNDRKFLDDVNSCVQQHIQEEDFNVSQMAGELNMSESTLYRRLKALTGCSTQEWIRKIRMERAQQLLLEGKHSISEVGYQVGYSNPSTFRYAFKEEFGITPKAYQASLQK